MLQTLPDRLASLAGLGIDVTVVQRFTRAFAALDPEAFVRDFLLRHLELAHVVVGYNVNFGRDRAGTSETLRALGARLGFGVEVVGPVATAGDGEQVSSTRLRALLQAGDMPRAQTLLGRPYALRGRGVVGARRGRTLGFPTANLHLRAGLLLPPDGGYAVGVEVDGRPPEGGLNIGGRPPWRGRGGGGGSRGGGGGRPWGGGGAPRRAPRGGSGARPPRRRRAGSRSSCPPPGRACASIASWRGWRGWGRARRRSG